MLKNALLVALWLIAISLSAQDSLGFLFPQNKTYPYGIMPQNKNHEHVKNAYDAWLTKYVTSSGCPAGRRVLFDDMQSTVSEGIGYGMLIAVYMNDQVLFDDFYKYYQSFPNQNGLMHWKIGPDAQVTGQNSATDSEEDIAFALIMAHEQWGSEKGKGKIRYDREAKRLLYKIMDYQVEPGTYVLKPGDMWGGSQTTNPSYFAPAYYRVFAEFQGDKRWLKVADKCYEILFASWNDSTGLVPDWCTASGDTPAQGVGWARENGVAYLYDAARTPWRIALDYIWFGNEDAHTYCKTVSGFVNEISVYGIRDGYHLNGERISNNHTSTFVGTFGVGIMATTEEDGYQKLMNIAYQNNVDTFNDNYFNDCLRLMTLMAQTGNFFIPEKYMLVVKD